MNYRLFVYVPMLTLFLLTACSGGGSGGGSGATTVHPTTAKLRLSTSGALAQGTSLAGIGVSMILPAGVSLSAGGAAAAGAVTVSGAAAPGILIQSVTASSGDTPSRVSFVVASNSTAGFGIGEFATVACDVAAGSSPKETDFVLADFKPVDLNGAAVTGIASSVAVELK